MLRQKEVVKRFLERKSGRASSLYSTGEILLDHDWYPIVAWADEKLLWNPFPYPSFSSHAIHNIVYWFLHSKWKPERPVEWCLPGSPRDVTVPFLYNTLLTTDPPSHEDYKKNFSLPDPRVPGAYWRLNPWDVHLTKYIVPTEALGLLTHHIREVILPEKKFPELPRDPEKLREYLVKAARHQENYRKALEESEALATRLAPLCEALGLEQEFREAERGNVFHARKKLRKLEVLVDQALRSPEGLSRVLLH